MPTPREAYGNTVERQGYSGARVQAADFGAAGEMIGRAAQGFGQDIARVGQNIEKIQERDAEVAAREADNIRTAKRLKRLYGEDGFFNREGRNALEDQPQLEIDLKAIDDEAASLLAKKPLARQMFDGLTQKRNADDLPRIYGHASKQRNAYEDQVDADAMDVAIDNAASSLDPALIAENFKTIGDVAERTARRKGMSDDNTVVQVRQAAIGKGVAAVAQKMELQSPAEAMAFVTLHADKMDPDDVNKLMASLAPSAAKERAGGDIGNFLVPAGGYTPVAATGGATPAAAGSTPQTLAPPEAALAAAQWDQESRGRHTNADGSFVTSSAGARGVSQVMPKTGVDPGYGVKPLQNNSREEYIRFGNDLRRAYTKAFGGNTVLGLIAYNWGPKNLADHIKKVGDPTKGQISEAAFVNSIPNEEAREYAPKILARVGVSVAGAAGPAAAAPPVPVGQEIDLAATINNIRASDRTFADKEALIAEATRIHGYGRQVKAETEERVTDDAWNAVNDLGDGFTDFDKLPLQLRTRLAANPRLEAQLRGQAASNAKRIQTAAATEREQTSQLNLLDLYYGAPEEFNKIDFRSSHPELSFTSRKAMMLRQEAFRARQAKPGNVKTADHSRMRTEVNRFVNKDQPQPGIGAAYDAALRKEQEWLDQNPGKPIPDAVRAGIAREVMMPTTIVTRGAVYGTNERTLPAYAAETARQAAIKSGRYAGQRVEPRTAIRAQLEQLWQRIPTEAEIDAEVAKRTTTKGLRL